jgi:chaperonin GroES
MKITPFGARVAVKPLRESEETSSGLSIPKNVSKEAPECGEIVAVGAAADEQLKVGRQVVFKKYAPDALKLDGEEILIVEETDVIALIA